MVDLTEYGWEEPVDESPFELPEGWEGGEVIHTGGNIWCRIWEYPELNVEVLYNNDDFGVGVQINNGEGRIESITTLHTDSIKDAEKLQIVEEYITNQFDPSNI